jgi:glutathione peroxidase
MSESVYEIPVKNIDGSAASLADHKGKVLLVVNVASKCGLTPQYTALEKVYETYKDKGLEVLGFPANNFMGQEPGSEAEIKEFCTSKYDVKFPLFSKISVVGEDQHPLYKALTTAQPKAEDTGDDFRKKLAGYGSVPKQENDVLWNFEKFVIDRHGKVVARFNPDVTPDDPRLTKVLEAEIAKA